MTEALAAKDRELSKAKELIARQEREHTSIVCAALCEISPVCSCRHSTRISRLLECVKESIGRMLEDARPFPPWVKDLITHRLKVEVHGSAEFWDWPEGAHPHCKDMYHRGTIHEILDGGLYEILFDNSPYIGTVAVVTLSADKFRIATRCFYETGPTAPTRCLCMKFSPAIV